MAGRVVRQPRRSLDGLELRRRREAVGMSKRQLATRWQMAPSTLGRWEAGSVPVPMVGLVYDALATLERRHAWGGPVPETTVAGRKPQGARRDGAVKLGDLVQAVARAKRPKWWRA